MLWKNGLFVRMFAAYGLSTLGDWFDFIAVSILLGYVWRADPLTLALLPLMYGGPALLLGQVAGLLADRWNKQLLMLISDLLRAGLTLLMLAAPEPGWLLLLLCLRSCANVFHGPAHQSMTRHVVSEEHLLKAIAWNGTVFQFGKVAGPLLGGTLAAFLSPAWCLLLNACSFILSAVLIASMGAVSESPTPPPPQGKALGGNWLADWREGWQILLRNRLLLTSTLLALTAMMAIQLVDAQFTVILRELAPQQPQLVGWVVSAIGGGALATVILLTRKAEIRSYGLVLGAGICLVGLMIASFGLLPAASGMHWLLIFAFLGGIGTGLTTAGSNYLRQKETPKEALGRVTGILDSLMSAVMIAAPLLGGMLITLWGAFCTFALIGILILLIGTVPLMFPGLLKETQSGQAKTGISM